MYYPQYYSDIFHLDISNGSNSAKVVASIKEMTEHYSRACVIIEKDRIKGQACTEKNM